MRPKEAINEGLVKGFQHLWTKKELVKAAWAEYVAERKVSVAVTVRNTTAHKLKTPYSSKLTHNL